MIGVPTYQATTSFGVPKTAFGSAEESFYARRASAFATGENKARRREISADAYLFLYKELVCLAGERTYCWPGMDFLATKLETSEGTLKRWMKELENANLIQRRSRPGGRTSLTFITAFLTLDPQGLSATQRETKRDEIAMPSDAHVESSTQALPAYSERDSTSQAENVRGMQPELFFGPEQEITSDRSAGSNVIPHSIKELKINDPGMVGGVSQHLQENTSDIEAINMLLVAEDVQTADARMELQGKPLYELQVLSQYLDKQHNVQCRPGLFVWLARQNFGTQLLAGRNRANSRALPSYESNASSVHIPIQSRPELLEVWHQVLDLLRADVPAEEFVTWLKPTCLLELVEHEAFVAVPNVFVRQHVEACFLNMLGGCLQRVVGRSIQIQLVIESSVVSG